MQMNKRKVESRYDIEEMSRTSQQLESISIDIDISSSIVLCLIQYIADYVLVG